MSVGALRFYKLYSAPDRSVRYQTFCAKHDPYRIVTWRIKYIPEKDTTVRRLIHKHEQNHSKCDVCAGRIDAVVRRRYLLFP